MSDEVILSVRSQLLRISDELGKIGDQSEKVAGGLKGIGDKVGDGLQGNTRKTESFLKGMRSVSAKVAKEMKDDFKALFGIQALFGSMKIADQYTNVIKNSISLNDKIRKLGSVFGIAKSQFTTFETKLTQGLGAIGLGAEAATNAMEGLSQTQVRGEDNLIAYSEQSGALAQMSGQTGQEGTIAKGVANAIRDLGGNPNDIGQMKTMVETLRGVFNATGQKPTQALSDLASVFEKMPEDLRKSLGPQAVGSLATVSAVAGPNAIAFLKEYLTSGSTARIRMDAMGFKDIVGKNGLDLDKFQKALTALTNNYPGDKRLMAQQVAGSPEAAEGLLRISENLEKIRKAEDARKSATGDVIRQMHESMTMAEAFAASLNKVKGALATPMSMLTEGMTEALTSASESGGGAAAVTAGGMALAAFLAGGALKALTSKIPGLGGAAKKGLGIAEIEAFESLTGKTVQPVYVVNAREIGATGGASLPGIGGASGAAGGAGAGLLAPLALAAGIAGAAALADKLSQNKGAGIKIGDKEYSFFEAAQMMVTGEVPKEAAQPNTEGNFLNDQLQPKPRTSNEQQLQNIVKQEMSQQVGSNTPAPTSHSQYVKVTVENKSKDLKATAEPMRGGNH